jgi:hypothetical protein
VVTLVAAGCVGVAGFVGPPASASTADPASTATAAGTLPSGVTLPSEVTLPVGVGVPVASDAGRLPPFGPIGLERETIPLGTLDVPGFLTTGPLVAALDQVPAGPGELYTVGRLQAYGIHTLDGTVNIRTAIAEIAHVGPTNELAPYLPGVGHLVPGDGSWEAIPPGTPGLLYSRPQYRIAVFPWFGAVEVTAHVPAALAPRTAVRGLFTGLSAAQLGLIIHAMWPNVLPPLVTYAANDPWLGLLDPGAAEWPGADVGVSLLDVVKPALGPIFQPMLDSMAGSASGGPSLDTLGPALASKLAPLSSTLGPLLSKIGPLLAPRSASPVPK